LQHLRTEPTTLPDLVYPEAREILETALAQRTSR
jgi:hypothetical protein